MAEMVGLARRTLVLSLEGMWGAEKVGDLPPGVSSSAQKAWLPTAEDR